MNGTWPTECVRDAFSWSPWFCVLFYIYIHWLYTYAMWWHHEEISSVEKLEQSLNQPKTEWSICLRTMGEEEMHENLLIILRPKNFGHWNDESFKLYSRQIKLWERIQQISCFLRCLFFPWFYRISSMLLWKFCQHQMFLKKHIICIMNTINVWMFLFILEFPREKCHSEWQNELMM